MYRRGLLAGLSASLGSALAGCLTVGGDACAGETWTGLGYDVGLDELAYDDATGDWVGRCSLTVRFSFVHDGGVGITAAGVALYARDGHRLDVRRFGDLTWEDVPAEDRTAMECGGYEHGSVTRRATFAVPEFPHYLGLWYGERRAGAPEGYHALQFGRETPPTPGQDASPGDWTVVDQREVRPFPPLPDRSPTLGSGVDAGDLLAFSRGCERRAIRIESRHRYDVGLAGSIEPTDPQYVPGLVGATRTDGGSRARVDVDVRPYRRPPATTCDRPVLEYALGLSFEGDPPDTYEVRHRAADGSELDRTTIRTGG